MWTLLHETALLTAAVIFLLAVASIYQFLMGMLGVPALLGEILRPLYGTPWLFLVAVSVLVMLFGMVLEGLPAAVVLIPVVFPISKEIGIHPVHFATVLTAAVGIGLFLPPIGVGLLIALSFDHVSLVRRLVRPALPCVLALPGLSVHRPLDPDPLPRADVVPAAPRRARSLNARRATTLLDAPRPAWAPAPRRPAARHHRTSRSHRERERCPMLYMIIESFK